MNLPDLIAKVQGKVGVHVDGRAGVETWTAIAERIGIQVASTLPAPGFVLPVGVEGGTSVRSEQLIATLLPEVQPYARALWHQARAQGIEIEIIAGTRSYEQQDLIFAQGRTRAGKIVTRARGGFSNHNFGIAFDVGVFHDGKYIEESPAYKAVGALGKALGLEWGGDWHSIQDEPHFELHPTWATGLSEMELLAELRHRHDQRAPIFA
jgi:peptidoglycan L-alanyl-D-glutamate endopeptidase CwlK